MWEISGLYGPYMGHIFTVKMENVGNIWVTKDIPIISYLMNITENLEKQTLF